MTDLMQSLRKMLVGGTIAGALATMGYFVFFNQVTSDLIKAKAYDIWSEKDKELIPKSRKLGAHQ